VQGEAMQMGLEDNGLRSGGLGLHCVYNTAMNFSLSVHMFTDYLLSHLTVYSRSRRSYLSIASVRHIDSIVNDK
jgi:hypothetical protein